MTDEILFYKFDLRQIIEERRANLRSELDGKSDSVLLNMDLGALKDYAIKKYELSLPVLGTPIVDEGRTKIAVGRFGGYPEYGEPTVQVDAHRYTLEVPFDGDDTLFYARGSTYNLNPPRGAVRAGILATTIVQRTPDAAALNQTFDKFLLEVNEHLKWLKGDIDDWNSSIPKEVGDIVFARRQRAEQAGIVASGLKFQIKKREGAASTYAVPVSQRKKITYQLPAVKTGGPPEPSLSDDIYQDILETLKQMSQVMERSPHAYATMDEETLRFQFLIPLNAKFEGEARAEVFNYGGTTDILITVQGKNVFVGECKFWSGAKVLSETVDQVLGYIAWRDTKCAILLFNRNRNFSNVLAQIKPVLERHVQFVSFDGLKGETEFSFTFKRIDDPARLLKLTVLAFDIPAQNA